MKTHHSTDRFSGPGGVELPRFSRRIGTLDRRNARESSAATSMGVLTPFGGLLQPQFGTDQRPLPDLTYLVLRPVVDRVTERERARGASPDGPVHADSDRGGSERTSARDARRGREPTVADALREDREADGSARESSPSSSPVDRELRTLETHRTVQTLSDDDGPGRTATADRSLVASESADHSRTAASDDDSIHDREPADRPDGTFHERWATPAESQSAKTEFSSAVASQSALSPQSSRTRSSAQFPPLTVRRDRTGESGARIRSDTPASDPRDVSLAIDSQGGPSPERAGGGSRTRGTRGSGGRDRGESRVTPELTVRSRESDSDSPQSADSVASATAEQVAATDRSPSTAHEEIEDTSRLTALLLDGDGETSEFVDRLYREFRRKQRIERERRGF